MSDLDELVTSGRTKEIFEVRRQVREDKRALKEAVETGRIGDRRARRLFQHSVDQYVEELKSLLNPPSGESTAYWTDETIGEIPLPGGRVLEVEGLEEYLQLDEQIVVEAETVREGRYYELAQVETEERAVQPPWKLLKSAFSVANEAAADLGLELDAGSEDRAEIDEELIEEIMEWRKDNL